MKRLLGIGMPLVLMHTSAIAEHYHTVDFESSTVFYELDNDPDGNGNTLFGDLWVDGGSDAYRTTSEYYGGSAAFAIDVVNDALDTEEPKDSYGTLFTKSLDLTDTSEVSVTFKYLVTNTTSNGVYTNPDGSFAFEVSADDGETWTTVFEDANLSSIKSPERQWILDNYCNDETLSQTEINNCVTEIEASVSIPADELLAYWFDSNDITIPTTLMTKTTVFRLKSYLSNTHSATKVYFDNIQITYEGGQPKLSEQSVVPTSDAATSNRSWYDSASFNSDDEWGVWLDGGRNAYTTEFLAEDGETIALRYQYVEGESNPPDPDTGEDTGEHKPNYSSIYTNNLDMTEVEDLEVTFSFVGYNMSVAEGDSFTLSLSTNSGIDFTEVRTWTVGQDFINLQRYYTTVNIPGDLTSTGKLTTTTMLRIQASNATTENQIYIDNLTLYTIGTKASPAGTPLDFNWSQYEQTVLQADASQSTYDLINETFVREEFHADKSWEGNNPETDSSDVSEKPGIYGAVEHTDCDHEEFGEHITQAYDPDLERDVFTFHIHQHLNETDAYATPDTDRCRMDGLYDDRQRVEIKTYSQSEEHQKATQDETFFYAWRFKLPSGFLGSDKFTHLHQLKPVGGDYASMPLITLTAVGAKYDYDSGSAELSSEAKLNLRYSPTDVSQVTITSANISDMEGKWVQVLEKVKFGVENESRYEIIITDPNNLSATPYLEFTSYSLPMWKEGGDFIRPKWGIYRSIVQGDKLRDEQIKFSDFVLLKNSESEDEAMRGDLLKFGEYVQGLENATYVSNTSYYNDLLATIEESSAENDTILLDTDNGTLNICSTLDDGSQLCTGELTLSEIADFETVLACYENSNGDDCPEDEDYYLARINDYIANDPETLGMYALWRLGGTEVSGGDAYNAYTFIIQPQIEDADSVIESFAYVGDGLFTYPDVTPELTWLATAVAYYGDESSCPDLSNVYCVGYDATSGYTSGDGTLDSDVAAFRALVAAGEYDAPYSTALTNIVSDLGDTDKITQIIDGISAAVYMNDHWGSFHQGNTANYAEIEMALGYVENTTDDIPNVTDEKLRYALAYLLFNQAFFNAIDTGTGEEADGIIGESDIPQFIDKWTDDASAAVDWYNSQSYNGVYNEFKDKYMVVVMANVEMIEATVSNDDGLMELADMEFYTEHESEHLALLGDSLRLIAYNRSIFYRMDTALNVFNWSNFPDGQISVDGLIGAASGVRIGLANIVQIVYQSLLLRAFEGDYNISDDMRHNIGNLLMAWDGQELMASDPGGVFKDSAIEHLNEVLDFAVQGALDSDTSEWLQENLVTELDYWMAEGSVLRTTYKSQLIEDRGYYTDSDTEDLALEFLENNDYDLQAAISEMQDHLQPLTLFTEYQERYDYLVEEILFIMIDYVEADFEATDYVEESIIDLALDHLPEDTLAEDGETVAEGHIADLLKVVQQASKASNSMTKLLQKSEDAFEFAKAQGFYTNLTSTEWQDLYAKGYLHAAKASATAIAMVAAIIEGDQDYSDPEVQLATAMTSLGIAVDVTNSTARVLRGMAEVAETRVTELTAIIDNLDPDAVDANGLKKLQGELQYFVDIQDANQSLAVNLGKITQVLSVGGSIYASVISVTNAVDAFESGNNFLGALYTIEATANTVATVTSTVELAVMFGYMTSYGATFGFVNGTVTFVAAAASAAIVIYKLHQAVSYEFSLAKFRQEAEQVFRPDIVNDDSVTNWNEEEVETWRCTRFDEYGLYCRWDEDEGSDDLDWIFTVDHPSEIAE